MVIQTFDKNLLANISQLFFHVYTLYVLCTNPTSHLTNIKLVITINSINIQNNPIKRLTNKKQNQPSTNPLTIENSQASNVTRQRITPQFDTWPKVEKFAMY